MKNSAAVSTVLAAHHIRANIMSIILKTTGPLDKKTKAELQHMNTFDLATCAKVANQAVKCSLDKLRTSIVSKPGKRVNKRRVNK